MATEDTTTPISAQPADGGPERSHQHRGPRGGRNRGQSFGRGGGRGGGHRADAQNGPRRGEGRSQRGRGGANMVNQAPSSDQEQSTTDKSKLGVQVKEGEEEEEDGEVCFICASPVAHYSAGPCNHRTCHICSLRMRALYKDLNCAHCRVSLFQFCLLPMWIQLEKNN